MHNKCQHTQAIWTNQTKYFILQVEKVSMYTKNIWSERNRKGYKVCFGVPFKSRRRPTNAHRDHIKWFFKSNMWHWNGVFHYLLAQIPVLLSVLPSPKVQVVPLKLAEIRRPPTVSDKQEWLLPVRLVLVSSDWSVALLPVINAQNASFSSQTVHGTVRECTRRETVKFILKLCAFPVWPTLLRRYKWRLSVGLGILKKTPALLLMHLVL